MVTAFIGRIITPIRLWRPTRRGANHRMGGKQMVDDVGRTTVPAEQPGEDERQLAEMGYKQELSRGWSAFTNFAISFTIISVLAGTFTSFPFAWQNGGPIAAS